MARLTRALAPRAAKSHGERLRRLVRGRDGVVGFLDGLVFAIRNGAAVNAVVGAARLAQTVVVRTRPAAVALAAHIKRAGGMSATVVILEELAVRNRPRSIPAGLEPLAASVETEYAELADLLFGAWAVSPSDAHALAQHSGAARRNVVTANGALYPSSGEVITAGTAPAAALPPFGIGGRRGGAVAQPGNDESDADKADREALAGHQRALGEEAPALEAAGRAVLAAQNDTREVQAAVRRCESARGAGRRGMRAEPLAPAEAALARDSVEAALAQKAADAAEAALTDETAPAALKSARARQGLEEASRAAQSALSGIKGRQRAVVKRIERQQSKQKKAAADTAKDNALLAAAEAAAAAALAAMGTADAEERAAQAAADAHRAMFTAASDAFRAADRAAGRHNSAFAAARMAASALRASQEEAAGELAELGINDHAGGGDMVDEDGEDGDGDDDSEAAVQRARAAALVAAERANEFEKLIDLSALETAIAVDAALVEQSSRACVLRAEARAAASLLGEAEQTRLRKLLAALSTMQAAAKRHASALTSGGGDVVLEYGTSATTLGPDAGVHAVARVRPGAPYVKRGRCCYCSSPSPTTLAPPPPLLLILFTN